jgi:hypothetical protein
MLAENKVRAFLVDVLSRIAEEKTGCDKPGLSVRDDEKVSLTVFSRLLNQKKCIALDTTNTQMACLMLCVMFYCEFSFPYRRYLNF